MIQRFLLFLGPARSRLLLLVIGGTGLLSLILNVVVNQVEWARPVQSLLVGVALVGTAVIIGGRMDPDQRQRFAALLIPSIGAVALGLTVLPHLLPILLGAAVGWIIVGLFVFRSRAPMGLQRAVRLFRKNEYAEAVKEIDALLKDSPDNPNYYRFRAEVLRVWGKLDRAKRDYIRMTEIAPQAADAFNGLSELLLQMGDYTGALTAAARAAELSPHEWVALYNLGMIEDRLKRSNDALIHLEQALTLNVKDARHRALIQFFRARALARLGRFDEARSAAAQLRRQRAGLDEWEALLRHAQAETLREVLGEDIAAAQQLAREEVDVESLADGART